MLKDTEVQQEVTELNLGNKIRRLRKKKALTLQNVSDYTGLSKALLSQIENGIIAPPLATLIKISKALDVKVGFFFQDAPLTHRISIIRKGEHHKVNRSIPNQTVSVGYSYETLAFPIIERHMEPFMVTFEPLTDAELPFYSHSGEEFIHVAEGDLEFQGGGENYALEPGDSLYFDASIPHALRGMAGKNAKALVVIYTPK